MKHMYYTASGAAFADESVEDRARAFLQGSNDSIEVSNELFVLAVRVLIYEGFFPHDEVVLVLCSEDGGRTVAKFDRDGRTAVAYGDVSMNLLVRLLTPRKGK